MHSIDHWLFSILNRGCANPVFDYIMPRITNLHKILWLSIPMLISMIYLLFRGKRQVQFWVLCAALSVSISDPVTVRIAKKAFNRARPCKLVAGTSKYNYADTRLVPGEECPGSASFPSSHASNTMALATVCWWFHRKERKIRTVEGAEKEPRFPKEYLWFLLPVVIGYTRIYLGYHYPSDVVGGWCFGAVIAVTLLLTLGRAAYRCKLETT